MDTCSSGEELVIKTRKPYTITKQRERWTEEEHIRFLEAIKLYGRAWQRIEEHIGTKTAVQIRSHAQKFFTKLEKEALVKGIPTGQALDIEIPPPRPKRKPSNPYPRKTATGAPTASQVGATDEKLPPSVSPSRQILDLEKEPLPEKSRGNEKHGIAKEDQGEDHCSEISTFAEEVCDTSLTLVNKNSISTPVAPRNPCINKGFMPARNEVVNRDNTSESFVTYEPRGKEKVVRLDSNHRGTNNIPDLGNFCPLLRHEKLIQDKKIEKVSSSRNFGIQPSNDMQGIQNYPRHVPMHIVDGSLGIGTQNVPQGMSHQEPLIHQLGAAHGHPNSFTNPAVCTTIDDHLNASEFSIHRSIPTFHPPFTPVCYNQDAYGSFFHMPTFSSLVTCALLQNPAAHAAASFAATFWPSANLEVSADSSTCSHYSIPPRQMNQAPSMEVIAAAAAATVAAATAWWAAHGLLPSCTTYHSGITCPPPSITTVADVGLSVEDNNGRKENTFYDHLLQNQQIDPEFCEALQEQQFSPKLPAFSSSESESAKPDAGLTDDNHDKASEMAELNNSNKVESKKQVERSSCGSNTSSGSELETDALDKNEKGKDVAKEADISISDEDPNNRCYRNSGNMNESWKEVSEEGRTAFQALFSREVLPQSFSHQLDIRNQGSQNKCTVKDNGDEIFEDALQLDLNNKTNATYANHVSMEKNMTFEGQNDGKETPLPMELGHGKLKARRTGFKPYKRCSVEATESRMASSSGQVVGKGPKRMCLEQKVLT